MATIQQNILGHVDGNIYGIGGYTSDNDASQHAIVTTADGTVNEIHWNVQSAPSHPQVLARFAGIVCFTSFYTSDDNDQHVIVATPDNILHEVYFTDPAHAQVRSPLYQLKSIIGTHVGMSGFFSFDDGLRHAAVLDKDGELHEVTFSARKQPDTEDFATQFDLKDIAAIAGLYSFDDTTKHTIVALKDGRVYDINYTTDQTHASTSFVTQFSEPLVNVAAFYSADTGYRHIVALAASGNLYDYSYTPQSTVGPTLLATLGNVVDIAAYYSAYDGNRHVILGTEDGNLHEVYYSHLA